MDTCTRSVFTKLQVLDQFEDQAKAGENGEPPNEESMDVEDSPLQDPREAAERMIEQLKGIGAPADYIQAEQAKLAALPKAKAPKPSQPIHDLGKLHHALGLAKDFHLRQAELDGQRLVSLQGAVDRAQAALNQAKEDAEVSKARAQKEETRILQLITTAQAAQAVVPAAVAAAHDSQNADQALLANDLKAFLQTANCPPHLEQFVNVMLPPPAQASASSDTHAPQAASPPPPPTAPTTTPTPQSPILARDMPVGA